MLLGEDAKTYRALVDMGSTCPRGAMYNDTSSVFSMKAFHRLARLGSPRRFLRQYRSNLGPPKVLFDTLSFMQGAI